MIIVIVRGDLVSQLAATLNEFAKKAVLCSSAFLAKCIIGERRKP